MSPKNATATDSVLRTLATNQGDKALLREARNQKRMAISLKAQDQELDQEINNLEAIHQQLEKCREMVLHLSKLQKKIDEAIEKCATLKRRTRTTTRTKIMRTSTKTTSQLLRFPLWWSFPTNTRDAGDTLAIAI
jgi:ABC-type Fe3+-citrate transport system substrate-binding protein